MSVTRAVLFDLGGTLYDYRIFEPGNRKCLLSLARSAGVDAAPDDVTHAYREAMRRVFRAYLPRPYYLHRDLFRDAAEAMLQDLGVAPDDKLLERFFRLQRDYQKRDLELREGVHELLRDLRKRGIQLGIVSNIDETQLQEIVATGDLERCFDWFLSSESAGSCKPDPGIFEKALEKAGCRPPEALFVGDTLWQDILGANRVGIRSVLLWHRDDLDPPIDEVKPNHIIHDISEVMNLVS